MTSALRMSDEDAQPHLVELRLNGLRIRTRSATSYRHVRHS